VVSDKTYKVTRLVGESSESIESAVRVALETSAEHVRGQTWAHVQDIRASLSDEGTVDLWQVTVDIAFKVEPQ
jgi:flavin-binding protein dodecin